MRRTIWLLLIFVYAFISIQAVILIMNNSYNSGSDPHKDLGHTFTPKENVNRPPSEGFNPIGLSIPALEIAAEVSAAPSVNQYDPFLDRNVKSFGVPKDMFSTTWWDEGPKPGSDGMAIILGHTQVGGGFGIFNKIAELTIGQSIFVFGENAVMQEFSVQHVVTDISKSDPLALSTVLKSGAGKYEIALVTCSGLFDDKKNASPNNSVVFASKVIRP